MLRLWLAVQNDLVERVTNAWLNLALISRAFKLLGWSNLANRNDDQDSKVCVKTEAGVNRSVVDAHHLVGVKTKFLCLNR